MLVGVSQKIKSLKTHSNPDNPRSLQRPPTPSSIAYDSLVVAGHYHKRGMYSMQLLSIPDHTDLADAGHYRKKGTPNAALVQPSP